MTNLHEKFAYKGRAFELLSFVAGRGDLWAPEVTGNFAEDCMNGRSYARELLAYMRVNNAPMLLGHVIAAMAGKPHTGVETGFAQELAESAMAGAHAEAL